MVTVVEDVPQGCSIRLQLQSYPKPSTSNRLAPDLILGAMNRILGFKFQDLVFFFNGNSYAIQRRTPSGPYRSG